MTRLLSTSTPRAKVRYHGSKTLRATQVYPPSFCRNASCLILYRGLGFREYVYNKPVIIQYAYIYIISLLSCNMHIYIYIYVHISIYKGSVFVRKLELYDDGES